MREGERNTLDELIDAGLHSYSNAEPRFGLGERVLRRVHADTRRSGIRWMVWAAAFAACAVLVAVGVRVAPRARPRVDLPVVSYAERGQHIPQIEVRPPQVASRAVVAARKEPRQRPKPRFEVPPPTQEEQALLTLVQNDPEEAARLARWQAQYGLEPIHIAAIEIKPLSQDSSDDSSK